MTRHDHEDHPPGHHAADESLHPDEVISPSEHHPPAQMRELVRDVAYLLPNLVKLLGRLMRDPRVPRRSKFLVGGLVAYLASPVDLVPDFIPLVGMVDDVVLAVYVVNHLVGAAGEEVVLEHWDGPRDLLDMVRSILDATSQLVPAPVRRWVDRLSR